MSSYKLICFADTFKDNETFNSINENHPNNPFRGIQPAELDAILEFGGFPPYQGPYPIVEESQYSSVLRAFAVFIVKKDDYEYEKMQEMMAWLFALLQVPSSVIEAHCAEPTVVRRSQTQTTLHDHGITAATGNSNAFHNTSTLVAIEQSERVVAGLSDDTKNYTISGGNVTLDLVCMIDALVIRRTMMQSLDYARQYPGCLIIAGKAGGTRKLSSSTRGRRRKLLPSRISIRPWEEDTYGGFSKICPSRRLPLFNTDATRISRTIVGKVEVMGTMEFLSFVALIMVGICINKKPEHEDSARSKSKGGSDDTSLQAFSCLYNQAVSPELGRNIVAFGNRRSWHRCYWKQRKVYNRRYLLIVNAQHPHLSVDDDEELKELKRLAKPFAKEHTRRFRHGLAVLENRADAELHAMLPLYRIDGADDIMARNEIDEIILTLARSDTVLDVIVPQQTASIGGSSTRRSSRNASTSSSSAQSTSRGGNTARGSGAAPQQTASIGGSSTRRSSRNASASTSARSASRGGNTARGSGAASTTGNSTRGGSTRQGFGANNSTGTSSTSASNQSRKRSSSSSSSSGGSSSGSASRGSSGNTIAATKSTIDTYFVKQQKATSVFQHPMLRSHALSTNSDTARLEKTLDATMCHLSLPTVVSLIHHQTSAHLLVEALNEQLLSNDEEDLLTPDDFIVGGRLFPIFLHIIIHVHGNLSETNNRCWYYLQKLKEYIFHKYRQITVPIGETLVVSLSFSDGDPSPFTSIEHQNIEETLKNLWMWHDAQIFETKLKGENRNPDSSNFSVIARKPTVPNGKGDYLYEVMKMMNVEFKKELVKQVRSSGQTQSMKTYLDKKARQSDTSNAASAAVLEQAHALSLLASLPKRT